MSAIRGSAYPKYESLLLIEPPEIDLNPEPIDLNPEDVPIPNGQRSVWGLCFLIVFCTGVAATLVWYGDAATEMTTNSYRQFAPRPVSAPAASFAEKFNAISLDLDAVRQNDKINVTPATATSIGQAPPVESQGDVAALQPAARLTDVKPPETLSEKGKPLAAQPRGSDHRSERVARREMVGTTENALAARLAPRPRGWSFGLP
jgi:hypothetical protein